MDSISSKKYNISNINKAISKKVRIRFFFITFVIFFTGSFLKALDHIRLIINNHEMIFNPIIRTYQFPQVNMNTVLKNIESRYNLESCQISKDENITCLFRYYIAPDLVFCMAKMDEVHYIKYSPMLGNKVILLKKNIFSKDKMEIIIILVLFFILTVYVSFWWAQKISTFVITPYARVIDYLNGKIEKPDLRYEEISQLYHAIKNHKIAIEQTTKAKILAGVYHDLKDPYVKILKKIENLTIKFGKNKDEYISKNDISLEIDKFYKDISIQMNYVNSIIQDCREVNNCLNLCYSSINDVIIRAFSISDVDKNQYKITSKSEVDFLLDEQKMTRIFVNLISNGLKEYKKIQASPSFLVDIFSRDKEIKIVFMTRGTRLEEGISQNLFDFECGQSYGTGLGLWIVQLFVKQHCGSIVCCNNHEGVCFEITIPSKKDSFCN